VPLPSLPVPSLPLVPGLPVPGSSADPAQSAGPGASIDPLGSPVPGQASDGPVAGVILFGGPPPPSAGPGISQDSPGPVDAGRSPLDFVIPGLIAGVPIAIVAIAVLLQFAGGAAWLPMIRRWLQRRLVPGSSSRLP
jgi:hypothetical protein